MSLLILQRFKQVLCSGHVIVQHCSNKSQEWAGKPTKSYTEMWWTRVRKIQEDDKKEKKRIKDKKEIWVYKMVWKPWWKLFHWKACKITGRCQKAQRGFVRGIVQVSQTSVLFQQEKLLLLDTHICLKGKLYLYNWASINTLVVNESRKDGKNVVLLQTVLLSNVISIMHWTKCYQGDCVHK